MAVNTDFRIPNLPTGQVVDDKGNATDDELTFRHTLVTNLQRLFGPEGCVVPSQTAADILTIQNNLNGQGQYTCAFGTIIYESDTGLLKVAKEDPLGSGIPVFHTITVV